MPLMTAFQFGQIFRTPSSTNLVSIRDVEKATAAEELQENALKLICYGTFSYFHSIRLDVLNDASVFNFS